MYILWGGGAGALASFGARPRERRKLVVLRRCVGSYAATGALAVDACGRAILEAAAADDAAALAAGPVGAEALAPSTFARCGIEEGEMVGGTCIMSCMHRAL